MVETLYRTEILLEPAQHQALAEIAQCEGRSISDIAREMIGEKLAERQPAQVPNGDEYLALLDRLSREWQQAYAARGGREPDFDVVEEINKMREERDAEILFGRGD
ncbi:MAG: hypothetical protein KIT87_03640 [Anaerolineae bacterium]|nr:hypothetical protein [Anaerolineae bacterium]